jgi:translation initiation factor 1
MTRVYSTEDGDLRGGGNRRARKGWVTLVTGLPGDPKTALKELKRLVGAGGALRDSAVEIQGDHAEKLIEHLTRQGHRVRRVGG